MSGLLNKAITNGTVQEIAMVPATIVRSLLDITIINPTESDAPGVMVWATFNNAPVQVDLLDFGANLVSAGGKLVLENVNCTPGEKIFVQAPAGMVVRITSVDES